ncbi:MAG: 1,4-dihydroxy-2-naphthoate polyprenyltransferase [Candidatus Zixiibacteriota bacterium]
MSTAGQDYSRWQIWALAARPKTLWAAIGPVIIGAAIALDDGAFHAMSFAAALLGAVLIQIGTNFANDLFDFTKKTDTAERVGPLRVTQAGLVSPNQMRNATIITFGIAFLIGTYLVYRGGLPIVAIGLLSILFGVLYTAGPYPLGYNGLGDIFVFIFFGPVAVGGTYFVMAQNITASALLAGISPGLLSAAILAVNNTRDIETDAAAGKKTLAVRFGRRFSEIEFIVLVSAAGAFPVVYYIATRSHPYAAISSLAIIPAVFVARQLIAQRGAALNSALASTGKILALYSVLFAVGWLL